MLAAGARRVAESGCFPARPAQEAPAMITVSTTNPAEARAIIGLLRTAPLEASCRIYLNGAQVAARPAGAPLQVTDPGRWPAMEPEPAQGAGWQQGAGG
jgi:hypothetical protein